MAAIAEPQQDLWPPSQSDERDCRGGFDRVQLAEVIRVCRTSASMSASGSALFAASRSRKQGANNADRLRKYLDRFGLNWIDLTGPDRSGGESGRNAQAGNALAARGVGHSRRATTAAPSRQRQRVHG